MSTGSPEREFLDRINRINWMGVQNQNFCPRIYTNAEPEWAEAGKYDLFSDRFIWHEMIALFSVAEKSASWKFRNSMTNKVRRRQRGGDGRRFLFDICPILVISRAVCVWFIRIDKCTSIWAESLTQWRGWGWKGLLYCLQLLSLCLWLHLLIWGSGLGLAVLTRLKLFTRH